MSYFFIINTNSSSGSAGSSPLGISILIFVILSPLWLFFFYIASLSQKISIYKRFKIGTVLNYIIGTIFLVFISMASICPHSYIYQDIISILLPIIEILGILVPIYDLYLLIKFNKSLSIDTSVKSLNKA